MPKKTGAKKSKLSLAPLKQDTVPVDTTPTEIVCIVDRSGSMESIKNDAIGGFNNFLQEQKNAGGDANMTIVLFDHEYITHCSNKPIKDVEQFTEKTYVPRGTTALLDAIGTTVNNVKQRDPKKAIIMILTDGYENSSREFNKGQIKQMMEDCKTKGWLVIYLSADANAFADAQSVGIGMRGTTMFTPDVRGVNVACMSQSMASSDYRAHGIGGVQSMAAYSCSAANRYDSGGWGPKNHSTSKKKGFFR